MVDVDTSSKEGNTFIFVMQIGPLSDSTYVSSEVNCCKYFLKIHILITNKNDFKGQFLKHFNVYSVYLE